MILTWHSECGHNPTISIEDISWKISGDAVNCVSNQIIGSHQNASNEQESARSKKEKRLNVKMVSRTSKNKPRSKTALFNPVLYSSQA